MERAARKTGAMAVARNLAGPALIQMGRLTA